MRFWAGVTDNRWYSYISARGFPEVNFWQPSTRPPFTNLPAGTPFLFKLRAPHHHIAGGGYFVNYTTLPLATAWEAFGEANGAASLSELALLINANVRGPQGANPEIGCSVVTDVFYLPPERWIPAAELFAPSIMRGRTYTDAEADGRRLWAEVEQARGLHDMSGELPAVGPRYGKEFLARARLGQGAFRTLVTDAYGRRCALTGESTLPVLEAAHIQSFSDLGPHHVSNGLLMRADFHKLFDLGLVTVLPDFTIRISQRIRDNWYNGKAYYRLDGQRLAQLPPDEKDRPNASYLRWHNERFAG